VLLFCGIHNAWDAVTYHVFTSKEKQQQQDDRRRDETTKADSGDLG